MIGIAVIVAGIIVLIGGVVWLIALVTRSVVARVAFAAQQTVDLPEPGLYTLYVEVPYLTWIPRTVQYALEDAATGREIPMYRGMPVRMSGMQKRRYSVRSFTIERAGRYAVRTAGLPSDANVANWGLLIARSHPFLMILTILMIIGGSLMITAGAILMT